jgi:Phage small terminase subunit
MSKLKAIKAKQIAEAKKAGNENPYLGGAVIPSAPAVSYNLKHYQAALSADLNSLKALKTLEEKSAAKKTMIETYWGFVADYIKQGHAYPNDVAVWEMIWLFDVLDIDRGLTLALHLIKQGIQYMPAKFDRDIPTFVCDSMYDWANELLKKEQAVSPYLDTLAATIEQDHWSLAPPVKSKVFAILAKHKNREGDYSECVHLCELAELANPEGAGVKQLKTGAFAKLKK